MEFYTGIHEPQVMEVIDEEIEHGPVIDDVEDTEDHINEFRFPTFNR